MKTYKEVQNKQTTFIDKQFKNHKPAQNGHGKSQQEIGKTKLPKVQKRTTSTNKVHP